MSDPIPLVVATRNQKKCRELGDLLVPQGIRPEGVWLLAEAPEVEETGATFVENAAQKACEIARAVGRWTLADDSGLAVDALQGAPGVHSARYAGPAATDQQNNQKLLAALDGVPDRRRGAQFVCTLAVADPQGHVRLQVEGRCRGRILAAPQGGQGFGYDPLFLIPEYGQTFGQLPPVVKSVLSHRARALECLIPQLVALLHSTRQTNTPGHR